MCLGTATSRVLGIFFIIIESVPCVAAKYGGGNGQSDSPYLIYTAEHMNTIGAEPNDWDKHFSLMADVDLSGFDGRDGRPRFRQIAPNTSAEPRFEGRPFTGVLDGNGHTISHLTLTGQHYLGLFGQLEATAVVMDLRLADVTIDGTGDCVGAIAGWNFGHVTRCSSDGTIRGHAAVGGLVGHNWAFTSQCSTRGRVEGLAGVGGLAGSNSGVLVQCYSLAAVDGVELVGGLTGSNGFGQMVQCYSTGAVRGTSAVGGLAGESSEGATSCFWDIQTSGQYNSATGIGLTTEQMHEAGTYLDAGWDWVGETENGVSEIWQMPQPGGYPVLATFNENPCCPLQGRGSAQEPYLIWNAADLGAMAHSNPRAHYRLAASLDLSGIRWTTAVIPCFGGTLDGQGRTVSNVTITGGGVLGLLGQVTLEARVANLGIVDTNIVGLGDQIGTLAARNYGSVTCCYSHGRLSGNRRVGGLIGYNWGVVSQCYNTAAVAGTADVGGLVGYNEYGNVSCCYSVGPVVGSWDVGGLVGRSGPLAVSARCFWDIQTSGQTVDAGSTGLPTPQMQTARTFLAARWDFVGETRNGTEDLWWIIEKHSYPRLWWEPAEQP
ncbi:MAG TPA: hypothetical protein PLU87_02935 [Sedimentisphaerales bacterium]|nr:hypothetical protein [Sedimentisphaerales bacterium]HRS09978.1 hypothetical protein [Sedimentisphaerales bacterium]HRV46684.1 hypothetical protein [Sedimentisphaerales bacterium]